MRLLSRDPAPFVAALLGFSLPLSTALTNITAVLVLLVLLHPRYRSHLWPALRQPVVVLALALFLLLALAVGYTSAPWLLALDTLENYRELLLLALLVALLHDSGTRRIGLTGLSAGLGVMLLLSYLAWSTGWPPPKDALEPGIIFKNHITQGLLLALGAYLWASTALAADGRRRFFYALLALLAIHNVVFVTLGKSGYLMLAALILLFAAQTGRWRGLALGVLLVAGLGGLSYSQSGPVQLRIDDFRHNLAQHQPGRITATGLRWEYLRNTPQLLADHPFIGSGTGSFPVEYARLAEARSLRPSDNPHNEYLLLGVQLGLPGVLLWLVLLAALWRHSLTLARPDRRLGQALTVFMALGCLFNSLLLDGTEGHLFALLAALVVATPSPARS